MTVVPFTLAMILDLVAKLALLVVFGAMALFLVGGGFYGPAPAIERFYGLLFIVAAIVPFGVSVAIARAAWRGRPRPSGRLRRLAVGSAILMAVIGAWRLAVDPANAIFGIALILAAATTALVLRTYPAGAAAPQLGTT